MNAEEIRREAVERIARDSYERWREIFDMLADDEPAALPWDEAPNDYGPKRAYWAQARCAVDALGDLLPTGARWGAVCVDYTDYDELDDDCTYSTRAEAEQQLANWGEYFTEPGKLVARLFTDWQETK